MYRKWSDKAASATAAGNTREAAQFGKKAERMRTLAEQQEPGSTTAPTLAEQMEALKPLPLPPPIPPPPPTPPPPTTSSLEAQEAASEVQRQQKKRKGTSASIIAGEQSAPYATSTAETGSLLG
jgi:type IV secretory pathway VirB10-like protein